MFSTNTQDKWYNHNKPVSPSERAARDGAAAAEFADAQRERLRTAPPRCAGTASATCQRWFPSTLSCFLLAQLQE